MICTDINIFRYILRHITLKNEINPQCPQQLRWEMGENEDFYVQSYIQTQSIGIACETLML